MWSHHGHILRAGYELASIKHGQTQATGSLHFLFQAANDVFQNSLQPLDNGEVQRRPTSEWGYPSCRRTRRQCSSVTASSQFQRTNLNFSNYYCSHGALQYRSEFNSAEYFTLYGQLAYSFLITDDWTMFSIFVNFVERRAKFHFKAARNFNWCFDTFVRECILLIIPSKFLLWQSSLAKRFNT